MMDQGFVQRFSSGVSSALPWCSNPESQQFRPEPMLDATTKKSITMGEERSVEEIINEVLKDRDFYEESGGGLTLSGGEIFAQFEFAKAILKAAKEKGIHTAIETTAFVEHEKFVDLIQYVDFIYTDLKHYNSVNHRKVTGVKNELIVQNIHYAFTHQKTIVLRIPVIPDFNDSLEDAERFATLFNELSINQVQLLPFHQFGENKYKLLGRKYAMEDVKALHPEDLFEYQDVFLKHDINCYF